MVRCLLHWTAVDQSFVVSTIFAVAHEMFCWISLPVSLTVQMIEIRVCAEGDLVALASSASTEIATAVAISMQLQAFSVGGL
mmetsp:Transcript_6336/g.9761  ORF Transcript_6336/g.9761 Transcript_6336/m.9761 type:complete len:82 (-) Transcript_6336:2230-2475(-)